MQKQKAPASTKQRPSVNTELLKRARQHVEEAIKEKKIFSLQGPYPVMRGLLRARGWVEKKFSTTIKVGTRSGQRKDTEKLLEEKEEDGDGEEQWEAALHPELGSASSWAQHCIEIPEAPEEEEEEQKEVQWYAKDPDGIHDIMSSMVRHHMPTFIWTSLCSAVDYRQLQDHQMVNHFTGINAFATKQGLCANLQNLPSFYQVDPTTFFPRCYRLGDEHERQAFIEDFRLTAARSLLKLAVENAGIMPGARERPGKGAGPASPSPPELLEAALQVCRMQRDRLAHTDIDRDSPVLHATDADWDCFLHDYYRVVKEQVRLEPSVHQQEECRALLQELQGRLPQLHMEGIHNLWIIKPGAKSRGRGITCSAQLEKVLELPGKCTAPSVQREQWVVQKYVERPLLIFGTKIDLRQWILVTDWNPLTIWFYRDSYVRFCSRPFSLRHLHISRHLCNVSIQKQWRLAEGRHPKLPRDLIWSSHQFQLYLQQAGHTEAWDKVIVPGMKEAVVAALHSAQERVGDRKGSFELYGADFIFGEDCQPWLLEINTSPTMAPCSTVTRRLCAAVQRDILRVVLDHRENPGCSTGAFELIYREAIVPVPPYLGLKLGVEGYSLMKPQLQEQQPQGELRTILTPVRPVEPKSPVVPKSHVVPKPPVVPKSLVVAKPLRNTKSPVVPQSPMVPRPPVVAKPLMDKHPTVTKPAIEPKPPAVPRPLVVAKPLTYTKLPAVPRPQVVSKPLTYTKLPAVPRPQVVSKPLTYTKPTVVPRPPVVPKPLTVTKHPIVIKPAVEPKPPVVPRPPGMPKPLTIIRHPMATKTPIEPRPPMVPRPPVMSRSGRTTQLPWVGAAQVEPAPLEQLHLCFASGSVPQAPPQPNPLLQWAQAARSKPGATALTRAPAQPAAVPPTTLPARPGQHSRAAGRGHTAAPGGKQKSCDNKAGHEEENSVLPNLRRTTPWQPLPPNATRTRHPTGKLIPPTKKLKRVNLQR